MTNKPTKTRRISLADLEETRRGFPDEVRADKRRETFTLTVSLVRHFFGHDWYVKHIFQDAEGTYRDGFIRSNPFFHLTAGLLRCTRGD